MKCSHDPKPEDKCKILVVDDDVPAATMMKLILEGRGFQVETANDGGQALVMMERFKPDLVFLDLMMPKINGWEFLDMKADIPEFRGTPVLLFSGYGHVDQIIPEGANVLGTIDKPTDTDEVVRRVEEVLPRGPK